MRGSGCDVNVHELPAGAACPECGHPFEKCAGVQGAEPKADDLNICVKCHALSRFTAARTLRKLSDTELAHLRRSPAWREVEAFRDALRWREVLS